MRHLRQSTASQSVTIGPFLDETDAKTFESGLTIANTDIRLSVNGGNIVAKNSGGGTYDESGEYAITFDATDTATVGDMKLVCDMAGALIVIDYFQILEENVYDALYASGADLGTTLTSILTDTGTTLDTHLTDMKGATFSSSTDSLEAIRNRGDAAWTGSPITSDSGTAQAGAAGTITLAATAPATNNILEGHLIYIHTGTGAGQSKAIAENGYNGTTKVATIIGTWEVTPDNTSEYDIYPDAITEFTAAPTVAAIADGVWDENTTGHTTAGTFGEQLKNDVDAILTDTAELQADWVNGGRLDLLLDATLADTNELQTDWANGGRLDLLLDATLADTNELQTDWANGGRLDLILDARAAEASIAALNDVSVSDILTTQMTQSYAADGVAPTVAQSLFLIQQALTEFAISGTTLTVKQLNGSTTAATFTLNSGTAPSAITRAT